MRTSEERKEKGADVFRERGKPWKEAEVSRTPQFRSFKKPAALVSWTSI